MSNLRKIRHVAYLRNIQHQVLNGRRTFNNSGLTEYRFLTLLNRINEELSQNITSGTELDLQEQILIDKKNELSASNLQLEKQLSDIELLIKNLFSAEIPNEEQLMRRLNILREIESNFKQLEIYLNFPSDTFLIDIVEKTMLVSSSFETYNKASLEAKQHNQVIDLTKNEIEKILAEIEILQPKLRRAQFANEQLNTLLKEQSKGSFLKEYIVKNKTEIVSIFKLIHTPTEFHDIDFAGQKITLITNESTKRTLSEISTGQRSALALSIFLSLNKKLTKGPNILIFDDPVVYVDDMNVLSFFDYLRELVIKSKRQVFFATANDDLAFLFRKKFEFLETEFKEYRLERESDNVKFQ